MRDAELPELRACTADLAKLVNEALKPSFEGKFPMPVGVLADRAGVDKRSIYRITQDCAKRTQTLDLADRVMMALDRSLEEIRLVEDECDCPPTEGECPPAP